MVHLAMFAKYWQPGKVKTRLAAAIGDACACRIYETFLGHLVERFAKVGDKRTVVFTPNDRETDFETISGATWQVMKQSDGDLGTRMASFFREAISVAKTGGAKTILIGTDTPNISIEVVDQTAKMLDNCDVVLGPSTDGGYYLVAMKTDVDIFRDIVWSSPQVLASTIDRIREVDASFELLPMMTDVDELRDFELLITQLNESPDMNDAQLLLRLKETLMGTEHESLLS